MDVKLSYFSVKDGNSLTFEERILALNMLDLWPITLVGENGAYLETCNNEAELRLSLENRGIGDEP